MANSVNPADVYARLYAVYGDRHWWPARTPYEVMVGAVLTQNTAWGNVEQAIANFGEQLTPAFIADVPAAALEELIRPAGFFRQKAVYLKAVTAWFAGYGCDVAAVRARPLPQVRAELLNVRGVGEETADSILCYACGFPVFVVDKYTRRLLMRLTGAAREPSYAAAQQLFMEALDGADYGNAHAVIVAHAQAHCRAKPLCAGCCLLRICEGQGQESKGQKRMG